VSMDGYERLLCVLGPLAWSLLRDGASKDKMSQQQGASKWPEKHATQQAPTSS
jgi:hypothetical protein